MIKHLDYRLVTRSFGYIINKRFNLKPDSEGNCKCSRFTMTENNGQTINDEHFIQWTKT